ncbi:MAG: hypothetical protein WDW38_000117 [Sanguina aurantia]
MSMTTVHKLRTEIYSLTSAGGPKYAPPAVRAAACACLDALFPDGRYMRKLVRYLAEASHMAWAFDPPLPAVRWVYAANRHVVAVFMAVLNIIPWCMYWLSSRQSQPESSAHYAGAGAGANNADDVHGGPVAASSGCPPVGGGGEAGTAITGRSEPGGGGAGSGKDGGGAVMERGWGWAVRSVLLRLADWVGERESSRQSGAGAGAGTGDEGGWEDGSSELRTTKPHHSRATVSDGAAESASLEGTEGESGVTVAAAAGSSAGGGSSSDAHDPPAPRTGGGKHGATGGDSASGSPGAVLPGSGGATGQPADAPGGAESVTGSSGGGVGGVGQASEKGSGAIAAARAAGGWLTTGIDWAAGGVGGMVPRARKQATSSATTHAESQGPATADAADAASPSL